jgi:ricin-type beta-trefoil lectin protein
VDRTVSHNAEKHEMADRLREAGNRRTSGRRHKRRRHRSGFLVAVVTAAALVLVPAAANAQTEYNVTIGTGSTLFSGVLDVSGASIAVGAQVIQWEPDGGRNQRWNLVPDVNGWEHIVSLNSDLCLATNGTPRNIIIQWPCSNSQQEDWATQLNPSGTTCIRNPESGMWLDVSGASPAVGTQLIAWYFNGSLGQQFTFHS